jgi:hypothetical protein
MRSFLPIFLCFLIIGSTIPTVEDWRVSKTRPEYKGVDAKIQKYESEYKNLALARGIKFKNPVTIGFNTIKNKRRAGAVIGLCTCSKNFREIDVDRAYWNANSDQSRRVLVFHEMTHCLCGRDHDYKKGSLYPDADTIRSKIMESVEKVFYKMDPGILSDGCPMSIMYPLILTDECSLAHWDMYKKEMFNRCVPY